MILHIIPERSNFFHRVTKKENICLNICILGFSNGSAGKKSICNAGDLGLILYWEDPLEKEKATHTRILPEKFHGQRSLVGYSSWGQKESNMTEQLSK